MIESQKQMKVEIKWEKDMTPWTCNKRIEYFLPILTTCQTTDGK